MAAVDMTTLGTDEVGGMIATVLDQRERARRIAVALEQEHAALVDAVTTGRGHIIDLLPRPGADDDRIAYHSGVATALAFLDISLRDAGFSDMVAPEHVQQ